MQEKNSSLSRSQRFWRSLIYALVIIVLALTLIGQLGVLSWVFDLAALFHDRYLVLSLILTILCLLLKARVWLALSLLSLLINAVLVFPYIPKTVTASEADFSLMSFNLYYLNEETELILQEIDKHDPDLLYLMEYPNAIRAELELALEAYPYRHIEPSRRTMGVAVFSKEPIETTLHQNRETYIPILETVFEHDGQRISLVAAHPWPPIGRWGSVHRQQVQAVSNVALQAEHPLVLAGDFNASQWSFVMRDLAKKNQLKDSRQGLRHTFQIAPLISIPLDHIYLSKELTVSSFKLGSFSGSDHKPLITQFRFN